MNFAKMHGCGNDFIVSHEVGPAEVPALARRAPALCDRRTGVGADGIVLVLPSPVADLAMRIINADGSEAEMCGNGIRCALRYALSRGLASGSAVTFHTLAGRIRAETQGELVRVDMGAPVLDAPAIPTAQAAGRVLMHELEAGGRSFAVTAVSMGNPHAVIYAEELSDELVLRYGPLLERHPFFPRRANIEFVKVLAEGEVALRVWERGCGETPACGTGACAAAVAGILNGRHGSPVRVRLTGGELRIEWNGDEQQSVFMTGPAAEVYTGRVSFNP